MKESLKRRLALLLCLLLCLSLFPATAFAEEGEADPAEEIAELTESIVDEMIPEESQGVTEEDTYSVADQDADAADVIVEEEPAEEYAPVEEEADAPEEELKTASAEDGSDPVREYVERCYRVILGREGDPEGIDNWVSALVSGSREGAEIVHDFIFSLEFTSHQYADDEVVVILYRAMLGRDPDPDGKANWVLHLNNGMSCDFIINGFSGSQEFGDICASYGIRPGSVALTEPRDQNPQVTAFVNRNYLYALERKGEPGGLNDWTNALLLRQQTPQQVAHGFVFSAECIGRNLSDRAFIEMLYHLYMDRDPDEGGMSYYLRVLADGTSREQIEANFGVSQEFAEIVKSYGLAPEKVDIPVKWDDPLTRENILRFLDERDPDGAFIIRNSDDMLSYWFDSATTIGEGIYNFNTAVHEQCHDYCSTPSGTRYNRIQGKYMAAKEWIYIGGGQHIEVPLTDVFPSSEMVDSVPESLRTSRFNTYINGDPITGSIQYGPYGMLDEFTAYCWGNHTDIMLKSFLQENHARIRTTNYFVAYAEFRYYILHYMLYAKEHYPDVYSGILNNGSFRQAFSSIDNCFAGYAESEKNSYFIDQWNALMNEMQKPEYANMANLLKS